MESPHEEGSRTIADYTGWIRRRWWVIVAVVLVGLAATALFTARQPRMYTATTSVLVQATGTNTDQTQTGARNISGLNMDTEAQLVTSLLVADRARILLDTDLPAERLASRVTVTVPPNTQVLGIGFSAGEPASARDGSRAFARAYLAQRAAKAERDIAAQITALGAEQRTQLRELQELSGTIAGLAPDSVGRRRAEAQLAVVQNSLTPISSRLSTLRASEPNPGEVISAAGLPTDPSSPHLLLEVGSGLGAALLLGLLLALLLDRADTRVLGAAAVADPAGVPVLLDVRWGGPPTLATDRSPADRDFGRLRTSLASALDASGVPEHRARIVVTCGVSPGRAAGLVTANLALSLDRFGVPVLVVCADPGSWTPAAFDVPAGPGGPGLGLAEVLRGEVDLDAATVEVSSGVRLLGPGTPDESGAPPQEMREDRVRELVARLYACPGYVLF
jgi:capsular polysaccharide biosynthesis protein